MLSVVPVVVADTLKALVTAVPASERTELRLGLSDAIDDRAEVASDWIDAREASLEEA